MFRRGLMGFVLAGALGIGVLVAEVVVKVAPPAPIVETRGAAPGAGYVWIAGYHNWNGSAYAWVPGKWEMPPRPHARWVAHHWVKRHGGWVLVEGRWR